MTISNEIQKLQTNLTNSYSACEEKGATLPDKKNFDNLPATISTITGGSGSSEENYKSVDENGQLVPSTQTIVNLAGAKTIPNYGLYYMYYNGSGMETLNFPDLETIGTRGLYYALYGHTGIKNVEFGSHLTVGSYGLGSFAYNSSLENVKFKSLAVSTTYALYQAFYGSKLKEIIINPKESGVVSRFSYNYALTYLCYNCQELERAVIGNYGRTTLYSYGLRNGFCGCSKLKFIRIGEININEANGYGISCQHYSIADLFKRATALEVLYLQGSGGSRHAEYMCEDCSNLMHVVLPAGMPSSSNYAGRYMFRNCPKLKVVDFGYSFFMDGYYGIFAYAFSGTTSGVELWLPGVSTINNSSSTASYGTFYGCSGLDKVYLPNFSNVGGAGTSNIFNNSGITEFHFSKDYQADIEAMPEYATLWGRGAGNATVYFDLTRHITTEEGVFEVSTNLASPKYQVMQPYAIKMNGVEYIRSEIDDTDLLFAWKNGDNFVYTCSLNPINEEPVYSADYQNIGVVESFLAYYRWYRSDIHIYTTTCFQAVVGQDFYKKDDDGNFYIAGQITAI